MSSPSHVDTVAAVVTALAANHGTGLDLSATGAVRRGRYVVPPRLPFAAVSGPVARTERAAVIGRWATRITVDVVVWAQVATVDLHTRVTTAETALSLILSALQTAADTAGNALRSSIPDLTFEAISVDADLEGAAENAAQIVIGVTYTINRTATGLS